MTKIKYLIPVIIVLSGVALMLHIFLKPVSIIAVHHYRNSTDILIQNPPLTDKGMLEWWKENNDKLKSKLSEPSPDGTYYINIWDYGEGYKPMDGTDSLCFEDIKVEDKCIEKNKTLAIYRFKNKAPYYIIGEQRYIISKKGSFIKD